MTVVWVTFALLVTYLTGQMYAELWNPTLCTLLLCDTHGGGPADTLTEMLSVSVTVSLTCLLAVGMEVAAYV